MKKSEQFSFTLEVPSDYFERKFNFLIKDSNSFKGRIENGKFDGLAGPDYAPLNMAVFLMYKFKFHVEEEGDHTNLRVELSYNRAVLIFMVIGMAFILIAPLIVISFDESSRPADYLFPALALILVLVQGALLYSTRSKVMNHFKGIIHQVELAHSEAQKAK